ncbi:MAG: hypothetical protein GX221_09405 [Candidatus Riflebacteria bacterium]|nr:hypothetical protein [Candidatus Riflebacteria bacterium]
MQITLKKDDFYIVSGTAEVTVKSGSLESIAVTKKLGDKISIPVGKSVPLLALEDSSVEIQLKNEEQVKKLETSSIPEEWDKFVEKILKERKKDSLYKILILGEVDTGKTFFTTYLANRLLGSVDRVAILDTDTGQSDIGCPGNFGMLVLDKPEIFLTDLKPTHSYYIGAHSLAMHFCQTLTGLVEMMRYAKADADVLITDTTGWVQGDGGRAIKKAKLDILQPDLVILMQRGTELEHLVKHLPANKVIRNKVSRTASSTSQLDRQELRQLVSRRYFKETKVFEIPFDNVYTDRCFFKTGTKIELENTFWAEKLSGWEGTLVVTSGSLLKEDMKNWPKDLGRIRNFISGDETGLMVALLGENQRMLAVARLEKIDFLTNKFRIRSEFKGDLSEIKGIQFGSLKVDEKGNEAGFLEPGKL